MGCVGCGSCINRYIGLDAVIIRSKPRMERTWRWGGTIVLGAGTGGTSFRDGHNTALRLDSGHSKGIEWNIAEAGVYVSR